ncbi:hypothetical protein VB145_20190 [Xanthomonas arboricola]|uniref:hypothetical protein n=1 Tax=Xanthomonas arboricola TaxID=56448 RepID=UPI00130DF968|nr:hypothetical protein [Xanthomonas arboricola]MEA5150680.1 hypothetical protein [Xanthomonas arboricola]UQP96883.1 hypothetical protein KP728_14975 [Xanthomonas arboricola pv. juglandis]UQQ01998.1 hypothetical protein KP727_19870 [Xanthomonas arboricola pv. juglandis]CAD7376315.1 hypothetical protein X12_000542 [Xanthomonas arboricola]
MSDRRDQAKYQVRSQRHELFRGSIDVSHRTGPFFIALTRIGMAKPAGKFRHDEIYAE